MSSNITLQKYIDRLDKVIASNDINEAKELQEEILAVLSPEYGTGDGSLSRL